MNLQCRRFSWPQPGDHTADTVHYILYSATNSDNVRNNLGLNEYSYYFVRERFRLMLEKSRRVSLVTDPEREVDMLHDALARQGKRSVLLSFAPPHRTCLELRCPTVPIFAWEFDTIPNEATDGDPRSNWRNVLSRLGCAITHSKYSAEAVRAEMGETFPVVSIPAPVWDAYRQGYANLPDTLPRTLCFSGSLVDSHSSVGSDAAAAAPAKAAPRKGAADRARATVHHFKAWYRDVVRDLLPLGVARFLSGSARRMLRLLQLRKATIPYANGLRVELPGIVYTSVLSPYDGRKNWPDMVTAFCSAFADREDATLVLKFVHCNNGLAMQMLDRLLGLVPKFKCRVIGIDGFLDDCAYSRLISATTFAVNTSFGEGQCLPLMEFMSCGKPAIAPAHTAMTDYIDDEVAFLIRASLEPCCWPHDLRMALRAHRYRIDWQSIVEAYKQSYDVAKHRPGHYRQMSEAAALRLGEHCSERTVLERIDGFVNDVVLARHRKVKLQGGAGGGMADRAVGPRVRARRSAVAAGGASGGQ